MGGKLPPFAIADTDGSPKIWQPTEIYFPNGLVTDLGNGTVFVNTGGGGGTTLTAATPILVRANTIQVDTSGATSSNFWRGDFAWAVPPGSEVLEARTPLLKAGTVLSLNTDGLTTTYLRGDGTYRSIYEARSPFLAAGTVLSLQTDGQTVTYLRGDGTYRSVYEARTPLLSAGTILSILTDGSTTNFLRGDGTYAAPPSGGGGAGISWGIITNTAITIGANSGYVGNTTSTITYTLPTTYGIGSSFRITEIKGGTWKIAQNILQKIYFGNTSTAQGAGGYLQSTDTGDSIELVCCVINSEWAVLSAIGNITFV